MLNIKYVFKIFPIIFLLLNQNVYGEKIDDTDSLPLINDVAFGVLEKQYDDSPNELKYLIYSNNFEIISNIEFGKRNDFEAHGNYFGNGWNYGIIKNIDGQYLWTLRDSDTQYKFGEEKDIFITGCDFTGDRLTDFAVLRENTVHVFSPINKNTSSFQIEIDSSYPIQDITCGRLNDDNFDDLAILTNRKETANKSFLYAFSGRTGIKLFKKSVSNASQIIITDFDNDGLNELAFSRIRNKKKKPNQIVYHKNLSLTPHRINVKSFQAVTPFLTNEKNYLIFRHANKVSKYDVIQNISLWSYNVSPTLSLLTKTHFYETDKSKISEICPEIHPAHDGANGFLWKKSDTTGKIVVLLPTEYKNFSNVSIMKDNEVLEELYFSGRANGDRQHWRGYKYPTDFPDSSLVVARRGKNIACWQIEKSSERND